MNPFSDMTAEQVIRLLASTFDCIEIRCLSRIADKTYTNVITSVFFEKGEVESIKKALDATRRHMHTDRLERYGVKFLFDVQPISNLNVFCENLRRNIISLEDNQVSIQIIQPRKNALDQPLYQTSNARPSSEFQYFEAYSECDRSPETELLSAGILENRAGINPQELIVSVIDTHQRGNFNIILYVPLLLRAIWPPTIKGNHVIWALHGHRDLLINSELWSLRLARDYNNIVERIPLAQPSVVSIFDICNVEAEHNYIDQNDRISLQVIHNDLGKIVDASILIAQLAKDISGPAQFLQQFRAWENISDFLKNPQSTPNLFEPSIHWMFFALGWKTCLLSLDKKLSSEVLKEDNSRKQTRHSADLIVLLPITPEHPVVLSLTSGLKDVPVKAQMIKNTAVRLAELFGCPVSYGIIVSDMVETLQRSLPDIPLIGLAELREIWQCLGNIEAGRANDILIRKLKLSE